LDDRDRVQPDRVVAAVRDVLGPDAVGAYLFGSAALGGLRPLEEWATARELPADA
jgi:predicted nucleotidyltransferase